MWNVLLAALGGAVGAAARRLVSGPALRVMGPDWPYGTFLINVAGSFLMVFLAGWLAFRVDGDAQWSLLLEKKEYLPAATYSLGSVALSIAGLFAGLWLARRMFG